VRAEVVSKVGLLARDEQIKDPSILVQLRGCPRPRTVGVTANAGVTKMGGTRCLGGVVNEDLETFTRTMVIERVVVGALVGLTPGLAVKLFGLPPESDTPLVRYVGRIFGIRNAVLGAMLWEVRGDAARLERMATLNAVAEAVDAVSASVPLVRRQGMDRAAASTFATSLSVMAGFLALRAKAAAARSAAGTR
jgi:hypothetical protein